MPFYRAVGLTWVPEKIRMEIEHPPRKMGTPAVSWCPPEALPRVKEDLVPRQRQGQRLPVWGRSSLFLVEESFFMYTLALCRPKTSSHRGPFE